MMMDDLKALIAKDYNIPSNVREESEMQIDQIYQNLSEENFSYKKPVTSKKTIVHLYRTYSVIKYSYNFVT